MMGIKYKPLAQVESHYDQLFADGHYNEAIEVMHTFLEECERDGNPYGAMIAHISIASCYYCSGQIESAFQSVLYYKQLCDEYGDQYEQYNLCHIQALIYDYEQNYSKAKSATEECIRLADALNLPQELSKNYSLMSHLHIMTENYADALSAAQDALAIAEIHCSEDIYLHCQIYCSLATAYVYLDRLTEGTQILDLLSQNPFIQNSQLERSRYLLTKGTLMMKYGLLNDAITYFSEAEMIALSFNNHVLLKRIYFYNALAYEQQHQFEKAYYNLKKYVEKLEATHKEHLFSKVNELDIQHSMSIIERRANIDTLSGVHTRYYLESTCDAWLKEARQTKDHICCFVFDVDDFKMINDQYGHLVGDEVIKAVGQKCKEVMHEKDTLVGRYGGDEFVILLKNFSQEQIIEKANELFQALSNMTVISDGHTIQITISMGIVCNSSIIARKFKQLFSVADQALYMAKNQGKNQIVSLSNMNCKLADSPPPSS